MSKKIRFRNVLLCDDIRQEISNKLILIGVYTGHIVLSEFPANIRLAVYAEFKPRELTVEDVQLRYKLDGKLLATISGRVEAHDLDSWATAAIPALPLQLESMGELSIEAQFGDGSVEVIGRKQIISGEVTRLSLTNQPAPQVDE
ncbi:hypothetical protein [Pelagibius sp. Alg239-R121]|uniref:hypothetical protein n=1 Tax=Pelagibius sp. Alg239-R121 TaxID=2993448 RepID=UPI0024A78337|nr:hypothetical protein [Pelagibius sp. Alg239-R121]